MKLNDLTEINTRANVTLFLTEEEVRRLNNSYSKELSFDYLLLQSAIKDGRFSIDLSYLSLFGENEAFTESLSLIGNNR